MVNKRNILLNLLAFAMCQPEAPPLDSSGIQAIPEGSELNLDGELDSHFDNHSAEHDGKFSKPFTAKCEYVKIKNMGSHQYLAQQVLKQKDGKFLDVQECENVGMVGMQTDLFSKHGEE
jgi:hypothetical protein